jgi:hypothetical protein
LYCSPFGGQIRVLRLFYGGLTIVLRVFYKLNAV